jgi:hypothetical protein
LRKRRGRPSWSPWKVARAEGWPIEFVAAWPTLEVLPVTAADSAMPVLETLRNEA